MRLAASDHFLQGHKKQLPGVSRIRRDRWAGRLFFVFSMVPVALALLILIVLLYKSWPLIHTHSVWQLLSGRAWKPEEGLFGFWPFISGTFVVTLVALILAVPPCLLTAIYLSEYAGHTLRAIMKPLLDLLAAIPSVVYGVWGIIAIVPLIQNKLIPFVHRFFGDVPFISSKNPTGFGILAASFILAIMIMPFIIAVLVEILENVPRGLKEASLAIGSTRLQTVRWAVLRGVMPGVVAGIVLGASRALGETMAVLMVVGNVVQVPHSLLDAAYPLPALIANNYGEMMSIPLYDSALMTAALILLIIILIFNIASALVLQHVLGRKWV
jgi:phosphate transport system permease protein